jgi:DNA-binding response OmpR family regulator
MGEQPAVLAVDDEPDLRVLMQRILSRRGYPVTIAAGVVEALAELDAMAELPSLLITDINMPDGRGLDLAQQVRKRRAGVAVLYVSGYTRDRAVAEGLIDGASPMLEKPFNPGQLVEAVSAALGNPPIAAG